MTCNSRENKEARGPWFLLDLTPLHRIVMFAINHTDQFSKVAPLLSVASTIIDNVNKYIL